MKLFIGVDGGQSSTVAVIGDERGRVLGRGFGPPADLVGQARASRRQGAAIDAAIDAAIEDARRGIEFSDDGVFETIVCGLSGYEIDEATPPLATRARHVRIVHDSEIALVGAFGGACGIVVIAGTGSVALGVDDRNRRVRVGGWGFLFGDEGSAFWIARSALAVAMRSEDAGEAIPVGVRALAHFARPSLRAVGQGFAHGEISRRDLAAFAPSVLALAHSGDNVARRIRGEAAVALAELAQRVALQLAPQTPPSVSCVGGVFADQPLREIWQATLRERVCAAVFVEAQEEPVMGALRLACAPCR